MLPRQEYGRGGHEQGKAHAPEMARNALCARDTTAHEHANVPGGGKQSYGSHEEVRAGRIAVSQPRLTDCCLQPRGHLESSDREDNQKGTPIENARFSVATPGGEPCRSNEIKR